MCEMDRLDPHYFPPKIKQGSAIEKKYLKNETSTSRKSAKKEHSTAQLKTNQYKHMQ